MQEVKTSNLKKVYYGLWVVYIASFLSLFVFNNVAKDGSLSFVVISNAVLLGVIPGFYAFVKYKLGNEKRVQSLASAFPIAVVIFILHIGGMTLFTNLINGNQSATTFYIIVFGVPVILIGFVLSFIAMLIVNKMQ